MQQGTPEQIKIIRHNRRVLRTAWFTYGGIAFAVFMVRHVFDLHPPLYVWRLFIFGYVLCGGIALAVFSSFRNRCPVCKTEFTRQSGDTYCEKCQTKFDA